MSAKRFAISAGHRLAAEAARDAIGAGGTTADAAIAAAAVQCVVEMPWCGLGGDTFAMVRDGSGRVLAFNGSGAAPRDILRAMGERTSVPRFGPLSVGVPGSVDAWFSLHERFGRVPMAELLAPAAALARKGVDDERLGCALAQIDELEAAGALRGLAARQPELASTLEALGTEGRDLFYRGAIATAIADHMADRDGALSARDLAEHAGEWSEPASVVFRDARVYSQPPVSMGILLLAALSAFERSDNDLDAIDRMVAIKKHVFGRILPLLADPRTNRNPSVLGPTAREPVPAGTDTTTLSIAGPDGMAISFIHSLFNEFGSRELVPGTGIVLNDRLANLKVDAASPNGLMGGRRPMHTLHSYIVERGDGRVIAGATPGGRGQVQTNLQVLARIVDHDDDLQAAIDHPRWVHGMPRVSPTDDTLYLESGLAHHAAALAARGHRTETLDSDNDDHFGSCTIVEIVRGRPRAAADHRRSACALTI